MNDAPSVNHHKHSRPRVNFAKYRLLSAALVLLACTLLTQSVIESTWAQQHRASARREAWVVLEEAALSLQDMNSDAIRQKYGDQGQVILERPSTLAPDLAVHIIWVHTASTKTATNYRLVASWKTEAGSVERLAVQP